MSCLQRDGPLVKLECHSFTQTQIVLFLTESFGFLFVFLFFCSNSSVRHHHTHASSIAWYSLGSIDSRRLISSDSVNKKFTVFYLMLTWSYTFPLITITRHHYTFILCDIVSDSTDSQVCLCAFVLHRPMELQDTI